MARIPIQTKWPDKAGFVVLNTETNQLEIVSDGEYRNILHDLSLATKDNPGLMSSEDKIKLENNTFFINNIERFPMSLWTFTGHTDNVYALAYGSDGYLYSGSDDRSVKKIFDVLKFKLN